MSKLRKKLSLLQKTVIELIHFEIAILKQALLNLYLWLQRIWIFFFGTHMSDLDLSGKTVLLTGAANGIGRSLAITLLNLEKPPAKLILWDIEPLDEFKKFQTEFDTTTSVCCDRVDLSRPEAINHKLLRKHSTEIHYFLAIAGYANRELSANLEVATHHQKCLNVNYLSNVKITKLLLAGFVPPTAAGDRLPISYECEKIVYMSSLLAVMGMSYFSEYAASKAALKAFAESLQAEIYLARKYDQEGQYFDEAVLEESQAEKFRRIGEFKQFTSLPSISVVCPQPVKTRFVWGTPTSSAFYHYSKLSREAVVDAIVKCMHYDIFDEVMVGFIAFFTRMSGQFLHRRCSWEIGTFIGALQGGAKKVPKFD